MSSILKALKKLESEKARKDQLSTAVASDILRSSRVVSRNRMLTVLAVVLAVFLVGGAGYLIAMNTVATSRDAESKTVDVNTPPEPVSLPPAKQSLPVKMNPAPADLPHLSGIVFQQESNSRLAIINDLPVMEGTLIEGYEVRSISPDKVVIAKDRSLFTLKLDQE